MRAFLEVYSSRRLGIRPSTIRTYSFAVRSLERFLGRKPKLSDFREDLLLRFLSARLTEASPKTVKRERADLLCLWRSAFKLKRTKRRPPDDLPVVRVPRRNPIAWTPQQVTLIVAECFRLRGLVKGTDIPRRVWWSGLVQFLYWTGARISAALAVSPQDLDLERRTVRFTADAAKTRWEQVLALSDQAVVAIAPLYCPHSERLFPWHSCEQELFHQYKTILRRAGLPADRYCMFHALRRTCYTLSTIHGSAEVAAAQLGHQTDMSAAYLDRTQIHTRQAADVLPELCLGNVASDWSI